jgi:hypothetical protein
MARKVSGNRIQLPGYKKKGKRKKKKTLSIIIFDSWILRPDSSCFNPRAKVDSS